LKQPGQIARKTLSEKNPSQKSASGVAQRADPEFKSQYWGKKKAEREAEMAMRRNNNQEEESEVLNSGPHTC
jgi:hypothetical protein